MKKLSHEEVDEKVAELEYWTQDTGRIVGTYEFNSFSDAMVFVNRVAECSIEANHHPNIRLHDYKCVTIDMFTHDVGGITQRDITLAKTINEAIASR